MAATEIAEAVNWMIGRVRSSDDSCETSSNDARKRLGHGVSGFADGDDKSARKRCEIVDGVVQPQRATVVLNVAGKGPRDAALA